MISKKAVRRIAVGAAAGAVAMVGAAGVSTASATEAPELRGPQMNCFVSTIGVPVYNVPPGRPNSRIVFWANTGQGITVVGYDAAWRYGALWGGSGDTGGAVYIHSNYLRKGSATGPACNF
jgi:hypothetical protein